MTLDLTRFQATGTETCFHDRHLGAQIYAGLNGKNWRLADYVARGAVGIIAGRFIDRKGAPVTGPLDERLIGADHQTLRRMTGLLVVSGMEKLEPTLAALRGGYVDRIVVDAGLASAVLGLEPR